MIGVGVNYEGRDPRFVETVVGKGYRFVGQIAPETMGPQRQAALYRLTRGTHAFALHDGENVIGRDSGPVRPPLTDLSEQEVAELTALVKNLPAVRSSRQAAE